MKIRIHRQSGLSFLEVCVVIATIVLVGFLFLPTGPRSRAKPERIWCVTNLKQIGLAYRLYSNDHGDQFPWKLPTSSTGTLAFANSPQVFRHFAIISNELIAPKLLVCPADKKRTAATDFTKLSNANLSYFIALEADESKPERLLSGDRNVTGGFSSNGFLRVFGSNAVAGWTSELHNMAGNVGLSDGSVQQVTAMTLPKQLKASSLPVTRLLIP